MIKANSQQIIHANLMSSALPAESDFAYMSELGYEVVVSLAQSVDSITLDNEDRLVSSVGMKYIHIPVDYYKPTLNDYEMLRDLLRALSRRKVWLHCTKNYRVSAFAYIYRVIDMSVSSKEAESMLHAIWKPNEVWQKLIDEAIEKYAYQYI